MAFTEQKNEMIRKDLLDEALRCAEKVLENFKRVNELHITFALLRL